MSNELKKTLFLQTISYKKLQDGRTVFKQVMFNTNVRYFKDLADFNLGVCVLGGGGVIEIGEWNCDS